ncbi:alpha/beta hydrolase family protein [Colwellia sp. RE-S-Sl-9]
MKKLITALLLFIGSASLAQEALTLEDIVSIPDISDVRLAPNGKYIAYSLRVNTKKHKGVLIKMYNTETEEDKQLVYSANEKYIITNSYWANNETLFVTAKFPAKRYRTPTTETRLLKVNIHTGKISPVIPKSVYQKMKFIPNVQTSVIDLLPNDKDHILMSLGGFINGIGEAVYRLPISDKGKRKKIQNVKGNVTDWITDANHKVRIAIHRDETTYTIKEKLPTGKFKDLWVFEAFSSNQVWPLAFGADNNILFIRALYKDKYAIYKVNLNDETLKKELVFYDENYDIDGRLRKSKETNEIVGVSYRYWDEEYKKLVKMIDEALPDTDNLLLDKSADGNKYILLATSDNQPGIYLIGDKKAKTLKVLAYKYPKLETELLATKKRVKYQARDGLTIEGYLTLPKIKQEKNLPTIIFPHGGPISYDSGGFDYWTQFFANKGYAVFQMNFRGSSGYGHDFMKQGIASWGQAMQDDVEDGTRWLIHEGIADKNKVCIVGASYGGYAALMGGIKTPELYKCIVSFAGVTDIEKLVKSHRKYTNYDIVKKQIGSDYDKLWDASPLKHAKKIKSPVLLIHGSKDRVVDYKHSEYMYDELIDEDKIVDYLEVEGADHYLSNNEDRLETFKKLDKFLDKYLPIH